MELYLKKLKKIKKVISTTALTVSILTPATMVAANAATITYTVKSGDTISAIAKKYNVSLTSLESTNKIINPNSIKVGQVMTIPSTSKTTTTTATKTTTNHTVTYTLYTGTATITTATSLYTLPSTSAKMVKVLLKGSKWKLYGYRSDGWYNIGAGWIKANCASTSILKKGATTVVTNGTTSSTTTTTSTPSTTTNILTKYATTVVPGGTTSTPSTTIPTSSGVPVPPVPAAGQMIYKVLSSDTATSIANKYNMTLAELQQINPQVTNWNALVVMQQILVYTPSSTLADVNVITNVTSAMKSAFIAEVAPEAIQAWQTNRILPSLTIAQAILESYWGESYLSVKAQNYFGIKSSINWTASTISLPTKEYDVNGNLYVVNVPFRAYSNISDSIADHTKFLMASRYSNIIGVTDYKIATTLIQQDGYATDPNYTNLLQSEITTYNLNQYDVQAGAIPSSN